MQLLEDLFERGRLIRSSHHSPNLVHLVRGIAWVCGVREIERDPPVQQLINLIGPADHIVFVLLDGLGMNLVNRMDPGCFVVRNLKQHLHSTCPSTTACALTTVATGAYANQHGITGWFTYLPDHNLTAISLPFQERTQKRPLVQRGIQVQDVIRVPPLMPRMGYEPMSIGPFDIFDTPYNLWTRGDAKGVGYQQIPQAIDRIIERVLHADHPTYTHLYLPEIDSICHRLGVGHESVIPLVEDIDAQLDRLATSLGGRARIIVTADHGLIDVPPAQQTLLLDGDPLLDLLKVPPVGDARLPIFHVREGQQARFADMFHDRFSHSMILLPTDQVEQMELFGPGPFSPVARPRFGDFIGIAYQPATISYHPRDKPVGHLYLGVHAGLSPQEMQIPLCLA